MIKTYVPIGDLCQSLHQGLNTAGEKVDFVEDGFPIIQTRNISQEGIDVSQKLKYLSFSDWQKYRDKYKPEIGDVFFTNIGTIGKTAVVYNDADYLIHWNIFKIRPDPTKCTPEYLKICLDSLTKENYFQNKKKGGTVNFVTKKMISEALIPLPPIDQQRRIAKILDTAINLERKQTEINKSLLTLEKNIFVDFFGDPLFNKKSLPLVPLEQLGKLDRGISKHRPRNDPSLLGGPYPLIQTGDVANSSGLINSYHSTYSELGLKQSKLWKEGTLCITIAANIAKTGILKIDACFPDSVVGFTSEHPENIYYVRTWLSFLQKTLEQQAPESAQKNINLRLLRELKVPYPPLDQMKRFLVSIQSLEKLKLSAKKKAETLNLLVTTLSSNLLKEKVK